MSSRLKQEVWALDRCSGCGACVAACAKGVLYWGSEQHPLLEERQKALGLSRLKLRTCEVCDKFCEQSCPRLSEPAALPPLRCLSARSSGVNKGGSPDDVAQAILVAARAADLIDGALVLDVDPWTLEPKARIVGTVEEMAGLVGLPHLWAPVLGALNEAIFAQGLERLAIVGPPCVAEGARRLREADNPRLSPYRNAIRLTIAHFCTGSYLPGLIGDLVEAGLGLARQRIRRLTVGPDGGLAVTLRDGSERTFPRADLEPFTRHGCGTCADYLGESADLAVGSVGALAGHATLIVRTPTGEAFVQNSLAAGLLDGIDQVDTAALANAAAEKERRSRGQALAECRILLLDALGDPRKRAEAKKRFVELFGTQQAGAGKREVQHGGCSGCQGGGC